MTLPLLRHGMHFSQKVQPNVQQKGATIRAKGATKGATGVSPFGVSPFRWCDHSGRWSRNIPSGPWWTPGTQTSQARMRQIAVEGCSVSCMNTVPVRTFHASPKRTRCPRNEKTMATYRFTCHGFSGVIQASGVAAARKRAWFALGQIHARSDIKIAKVAVFIGA